MPSSLISQDSIAYCIGVGVDATFDIGLAKQFGVEVHSFDPTPFSMRYMESLSEDDRVVRFHPWAVWDQDTDLTFFEPVDPTHSHSAFDLGATGRSFQVPAKTIRSIQRELGHDRLDVLKIDIEGSWDRVVRSMLSDQVFPKVLCIEFDSPTSLPRVMKLIRLLQESGYTYVHREKDNYLFCLNR